MEFDLNDPQVVRKLFGEGDTLRDTGLTTPPGITRRDNILYGADPEWNLMDIYYPEGTEDSLPTIISVHGGGWVYGDKDRYQFYCMDLALRGFTVVNFSYRLAPENVFPAAHEDINAVFRYLAEHAAEYHIDLSKLFLVGDSAGANLGSQYLGLLTDESYRALFPFPVPYDKIQIRGAALNCGVYDSPAFCRSDSGGTLLHYLDFKPDTYAPQMDLLSHITEDYPPCFVMTSACDFLREQALPFYRHLQTKGVDCEYHMYGSEDRPDLGHVFHLNIRLPEAREVNDQECAFFRHILEAEEHRKTALQIAEEGIVLLENKNGFLPLNAETKIALFGSAAHRTIKGGTGSGDVNSRSTVSIEDGLHAFGKNVISPKWLDEYDRIVETARYAWRDEILEKENSGLSFDKAYFAVPWQTPDENPITDEELALADTVLYAVGRISGEGADRRPGKGDWLLSDAEYGNLKKLSDAGKKIVLVLNTGGIMDLRFVDELPGIQAVVLLSQAGMESGTALAEIIYGVVGPSGRLTDTWAASYDQYPGWDSFGAQNGDLSTEQYKEGIFVGYRWFDVLERNVRYPFGYGLSYTSFDIDFCQLREQGDEHTLTARVTNTGKHTGKTVLQLYAAAPRIPTVQREKKRLVAFAKTPLLSPGESATLQLRFGKEDLLRFDEGHSAWFLDAGTYSLLLGENASNAVEVASLSVAGAKSFPVHSIVGTEEELYDRVRPPRAQTSAEEEDILRQLTVQEKIELVCGVVAGDSTVGASSKSVPGAAGETVSIMRGGKKILPEIVLADGPAGLRLSPEYEADIYGNLYPSDVKATLSGGIFAPGRKPKEDAVVHHQYATAFPIGTMVAQTWNLSLAQAMGHAVGEEMLAFHVQLWLAPGMNIHRNPLCGRNFEYFSEDPLLTGKMAAAITKGVQALPGCGVTVKHFACNNQEDNRFGVNCQVGERALREIYLRGFEIAIREAAPAAIMTAYNQVNGIYAANHYGLCTIAARNEWGFDGLIMTDWTTTSNGSVSHKCMKAGNTLIMPGMDSDHQELRNALKDGQLLMDELDRNVCQVIHTVRCLREEA